MTGSDERQRWQRLSQLFERLVDLPADAREAILAAECAGDAPLRAQLERMLLLDRTPHAMDEGVGAVMRQGGHDDDAGWIAQAAHERLGPWQLQGVLGTGASGAVFAARRMDDSGQRAAVKRLRQRWDGSPQALRFLQERRILAVLSHPNIPRLLDHGLDAEGRPWFALELVQGRPVNEWADAHRLGLAARIGLFLQVAAAVQHAHAHFIVHRDLKPGNVLVDGEGHPMVLDFGVAKRLDVAEGQTRTGLMAGFTPEYAAPEQVTGAPVSAATDVYALGVLLYQLLTGRLPYAFDAVNLRRMAEAISERPPLRVEQAIVSDGDAARDARLAARDTDLARFRRYVRGDLARILQTALAKEPERRYASVRDFSVDLEKFLQGRPVSVGGDTLWYRARKFVARNRWSTAMAGITVLALAMGFVATLMQSQQARQQAARADREAHRAQEQTRTAEQHLMRQQAVTDFMFNLFSSADFQGGGHAAITLREALDLGVERARADFDETPEASLTVMAAAASSYSAWRDDALALALVEEAITLQERKVPDAHLERSRLLGLRAWADLDGDLAQRVGWARESVALARRHGRLDDLVSRLSDLSTLLSYAGRSEEALEVSAQILALLREHGREESRQFAVTMSSRAIQLGRLQRHDEAIRTHREAVERMRRLYPDASMQVAWQRAELGINLLWAKRPAEALAELRKALPVVEADNGSDHYLTQLVRYKIGEAYAGMGQHAEALPYMEHAYRQSIGSNDIEREIGSARAYARTLAALQRCPEARAIMTGFSTVELADTDAWFEEAACPPTPLSAGDVADRD